MTIQNLSSVASDVITSYGKTAENVINAYRSGGQRVIGFVDQRFQNVLNRPALPLSTAMRGNLATVQKTISGYYVKGIELSSGGAQTVVHTVVDLAGKGVERIAANASSFDKAYGTRALDTLSGVVLPGAHVVSKVASSIEQRAGRVAEKIAGGQAAVKASPAKRKAVRKPLAKAAPAKRAVARKTRAQGERLSRTSDGAGGYLAVYPRPSMQASVDRWKTLASAIAPGCVVAHRLQACRSASVCAALWPSRG